MENLPPAERGGFRQGNLARSAYLTLDCTMSVTEASFRVLAVALIAGLVAYAYSYWYFRFASSRAGQVTKGTRFLLRLLALPPAIVVVGALAVPVLDKPLFKLICETALLFFGAPTSIILFAVPALLKMNAASRMVGTVDKPEIRLSRGQLRAVVFVVYLVALSLWLIPLRATHAPDVALMLIVAVGVTILRFGSAVQLVARLSGDDKAFASRQMTHLVIVSWLFAANTVYRAI